MSKTIATLKLSFTGFFFCFHSAKFPKITKSPILVIGYLTMWEVQGVDMTIKVHLWILKDLTNLLWERPRGKLSKKRHWVQSAVGSWDWGPAVSLVSWIRKVTHRHSVSYSVKDGILHILWTILQIFSPYTEKLLGRIGVFLDIEGRGLTFFSVAKCPLILSLVIQFLCQALFLNWTQTLRNETRDNAIKSHATKYISFCISFSWEILCEIL